MKFLASLLLISIVFLSSFRGSAEPSPVAKKDCAGRMTKKACCSNDPQQTQHHEQGNSCEKQGCNMLLSCCATGFLAVEPVDIKYSAFSFIEIPVPFYKCGDSAGYLATDWKPPKV